MPLTYEHIRSSLAGQPLFEDKTWQLSPEAWPLTPAQVAELEAIGAACLEFHQALETLYLRSVAGKNLLRNKPLLAPWVADYLDRGKPAALVEHARDPQNRGVFPTVLRPDLLLTDEGFVLTELDSVPGGIGLTAFLNRLYSDGSATAPILGAGDAMIRDFHASLTALRPGVPNPLIALIVSDEAGTYRPEMEWLAARTGQELTGGLRPEHFKLAPATNRNLKAEVSHGEALGNEQLLTCRLEEGGHLVQVRVGPETILPPGASLHLDIDPRGWRLFDASGEALPLPPEPASVEPTLPYFT